MSSELYDQGTFALQELVKGLQAKKIFLWTIRPLTLSLVAGTTTYSLSTDPAVSSIDRAYLRENNIDTPIEVMSLRQYADIPNKTVSGNVQAIAVDMKASPTAYVWPVPAANGTIYYLGICKAEDWETAAGSEDFPVKWQRALTYLLAADLADEYISNVSERTYLTEKAEELFREAAKSDSEREDFTFVAPAYPVRRC